MPIVGSRCGYMDICCTLYILCIFEKFYVNFEKNIGNIKKTITFLKQSMG